MSACERAADELLSSDSLAMSPSSSSSVSRQGLSLQNLVALVRLVLSDVLEGVRWLSHHALAAVGLVAVLAVVFLATQAEVRRSLEAQALNWLSERATMRALQSEHENA